MRPKMIDMDELAITGLTGGGADPGAVWAAFDRRYNVSQFPRADGNGYEIRFFTSRFSGKTPDTDKDVHVGFLTKSGEDITGFSTVMLPAARYAVFDAAVANGYDSQNAAMEQWIADNAESYRVLEFHDCEYVIECYNEKFKGGNQPDSVVEIWLPVKRRQVNG